MHGGSRKSTRQQAHACVDRNLEQYLYRTIGIYVRPVRVDLMPQDWIVTGLDGEERRGEGFV